MRRNWLHSLAHRRARCRRKARRIVVLERLVGHYIHRPTFHHAKHLTRSVRRASGFVQTAKGLPTLPGRLQTPLRLESGDSPGYALGWNVERVLLGAVPVRPVGHKASSMGGTTSLMAFPDLVW